MLMFLTLAHMMLIISAAIRRTSWPFNSFQMFLMICLLHTRTPMYKSRMTYQYISVAMCLFETL